jgi:hypothetical protein
VLVNRKTSDVAVFAPVDQWLGTDRIACEWRAWRQRWHNRRGFALARLGEIVSIALKLKVRRGFCWFVVGF